MSRCWDPTHGSLSSDNAFDACQHRWLKQYRQKEVRDSMGAPAVVGLAVDSYLTDALMGREPGSVRRYLTDVAAEISRPDADLDFEAMERKATSLLDLAMTEVVPGYQSRLIATQVELHFQVPGVERVFHGHLDLVLETPNGGIEVRDWKTSERRLEPGRADSDNQLTRYALGMLYDPAWGMLPEAVGLDGLIYRKASNSSWYDRQDSTRSLEQLETHVEQIKVREAHKALVEAGTIPPLTNGKTAMYGCGGCPVRPVCPAWAHFNGEEVAA